jgi:hypothetical protein
MILRRWLGVALALLCASCSHSGVVGSATVTGTYALTTVNGSPLPFALSATQSILDDSYTLFQGGTYARTWRRRTMSSGAPATETFNEAGQYIIGGTSITFRRGDVTGQLDVLAQYSPNAFTVVLQNQTSVYRKD